MFLLYHSYCVLNIVDSSRRPSRTCRTLSLNTSNTRMQRKCTYRCIGATTDMFVSVEEEAEYEEEVPAEEEQ